GGSRPIRRRCATRRSSRRCAVSMRSPRRGDPSSGTGDDADVSGVAGAEPLRKKRSAHRRGATMSIAPTRLAVAMVRPPQALVNRGFTDLHAEPDPSSERVDQAHYGERFTLLGREDEWYYAQGPDHYFGWIWEEHVDEVAPPERRIVGVVA